ncbi:MAG: hypothetical protein DRG20_06695 [Deltaproteobacteria bacterium]|nr:hypothetical protein [Deltaproteobacteria bacterium]RLA88049.1 MAG: hypothetical protein DRG20_06695 [Deltaproteobacteria bacterium]
MVEVEVIDATQTLQFLRSLDSYTPPFEITGTYRLIDNGIMPEATIMVKAQKKEMHEASTGVGPVDALAKVLKKALTPMFPELNRVKLVDFISRIFDSTSGAEAKVEVKIYFSNGESIWSCHAFSENINMASFLALVDGYEYAILMTKKSNLEEKQPFPEISE